MKPKFLFLIASVFLLFALSSVSAVAVFGTWSNGVQTMQITNGQSATFDADFFSLNPPMTLNIKLYNSSNALVATFESNKVVTGNGFTQNYAVTNTNYQNPGVYTLVISGSDAFPSTQSQVLTLTVNPVPVTNNPPVITTTAVTSVNENAAYSYDVNATDADGDTLTYSLTVGPTWLSINANTGLITGTAPAVTANTNFPVTVSVNDGTTTVTQSYTLTVNDVPIVGNNAPVITTTPVTSVNRNALYTYDVNATDADGDTLTYSISNNTNWLSINAATGLITGTAPNVATNGQINITVTVNDGRGGTTTQTYTLTIVASTAPPVITTTPVTSVIETFAYSYDVNATDIDGNTLTYSFGVGSPTWLSIDPFTGLITGNAPGVAADTVFPVYVIVSDSTFTTTQSYNLTVVNVVVGNNPPVISSTPITQVNESNNYVYQVAATDADGDALTYSLNLAAPTWLTIDATTGLITGTAPSVTTDTNFSLDVVVTDGVATTTQSYVITVKDVVITTNNAPVINSVPVVQINESQNYTYQINATDPENDVLLYSFFSAPSWLTINAATGLITGTAPAVSFDTDFVVMIDVFDGTNLVPHDYVITVKNVATSSSSGGSSKGGKNSFKTVVDAGENKQYFENLNKKTPVIDLGSDGVTSASNNRVMSGVWGVTATAFFVLIAGTLIILAVLFFKRA